MKAPLAAAASLLLALTVAAPARAAQPAANTCRKLPAGKRIVKMTLKPDTDIADLVAWISSITCRQFIVPGSIDTHAKKVTIISPQLITPDDAYQLFLDALDSVGLTVVRTGTFLRVIETTNAKSFPLPVYVDR
jgi:general secretion pathway protein D